MTAWNNMVYSNSTGGEPDLRPGHRLLHLGEEVREHHPGVKSPVRHELCLLQPFYLRLAARQVPVLSVSTLSVPEESKRKGRGSGVKHPDDFTQGATTPHLHHCDRFTRCCCK